MTEREPPHCPTCHCGEPDPRREADELWRLLDIERNSTAYQRERIAKLERALRAWRVAFDPRKVAHNNGPKLSTARAPIGAAVGKTFRTNSQRGAEHGKHTANPAARKRTVGR